jgi:predicted nucleic acid-binding protein
MALVIDSSVVIAVERQGQSLAVLSAATLGQPVALAAITASELLGGVLRAAPAQRQQQRHAFVEAVLAQLPILPFDLPVARTHAGIWAALLAAGQPIGPNDLLIAATALTHGYGVLTHNRRDFDRIPGLIVTQPPW